MLRRVFILNFLMLAPALVAQVQPAQPRRPRGIYAVVNVEDGINQEQNANPAITTAQLDAYFNNYYQGLLNNPAIAGLTPPGALGHTQPQPSGRCQLLLLGLCG